MNESDDAGERRCESRHLSMPRRDLGASSHRRPGGVSSSLSSGATGPHSRPTERTAGLSVFAVISPQAGRTARSRGHAQRSVAAICRSCAALASSAPPAPRRVPALDELHDVIGHAILLADAEHRDDVGVVQLGG